MLITFPFRFRGGPLVGQEILLHFQFIAASGAVATRVCQMGGHTHADTLTPVEPFEDRDDEKRAELSGQTLCESCALSPDIGAGWYGLTLEQMRELWAMARREHAELAEKARRDRFTAACLHDIQSAAAALEQAGANQGVDRFGKVA